MALGVDNLVGALTFGILASGTATIPSLEPGAATGLIIGSLFLSFFIKWLFEKIRSLILSWQWNGFYLTCFMAGILVTVGFYILHLPTASFWLFINGVCWIIMAFVLIRSISGTLVKYG